MQQHPSIGQQNNGAGGSQSATPTQPAASSSLNPVLQRLINNMVYVEGGTFQMGSDDIFGSAKPVHQVTISSYYIGKYEVTQEEWEAVMRNNPTGPASASQRVYRGGSWYDCVSVSFRSHTMPSDPYYALGLRLAR